MNSTLPKRKSTRIKGYNYNSVGSYFITVCVKERKGLLGHIVGNGACDIPQMHLYEKGKILEFYLEKMSKEHPYVHLDKYVIMPDHFHMILTISECGLSQAPNPTNSEISKFISLLKRYCNQRYGENIWQASFYDHIIRGEQDYQMIWEYIDQNVQRKIEKTK